MVPKIDQHSLDFFYCIALVLDLTSEIEGWLVFNFSHCKFSTRTWTARCLRHTCLHSGFRRHVMGCIIRPKKQFHFGFDGSLTADLKTHDYPIRSKSQRDPHRKDQYNIPVNMGHS